MLQLLTTFTSLYTCDHRTYKEMYRRELLNQPMRVQIAGLPHTVIISLSELNKRSKQREF